MRYAVRCKYISTNPLDDVKPPTVKTRAMDVLTPEQVNRLLDMAYGDRFECAILLGALVALRVGEVLSLRYEDLDLVAGTISIRRTLWRNKTYSPKTEASFSIRTAPDRSSPKEGNVDLGASRI
jgi:integrase